MSKLKEPSRKFIKRCAFTLAEVLITLSIIGIVAVLTLSPVITSYKERATVTKLKKFYVEMNNAIRLTEMKKGKMTRWNWSPKGEAPTEVFNMLAENLNISKNCGAGAGCFASADYIHLSGGASGAAVDTLEDRNKALLSNGMSIDLISYGKCANMNYALLTHVICGTLHVDTNGKEGPNQYGKDFFWFWFTTDGIVPMGTGEDNYATESNGGRGCGKDQTGFGCAAWVIEKGNMDYLK